MSFAGIAAAGVSTIGTLAVFGTVTKVAGGMSKNYSRNGPRPHAPKRPVTYSGKRVMAHRAIYKKTSRKKGYSIF